MVYWRHDDGTVWYIIMHENLSIVFPIFYFEPLYQTRRAPWYPSISER